MTSTPARVSPLQTVIALAFVTGMIWLLFNPSSPLNSSVNPTSPPASTPADGDAAGVIADARPPRVASLSPAITDTLVELGLRGSIVGRSPYCLSVDREIPVVGDLRSFDAERLLLVAPEIVFVQPPLAGVDPALVTLCASRGIAVVEQRIDSIADLRALLASTRSAFEAAASPRDPSARTAFLAQLATALEQAEGVLDGPKSTASSTRAPRVLLLASSDPFLAVGEGSYLHELLLRAGASNALDRTGYTGYVEMSVEAIVASAPEIVLGIASHGAAAERMSEVVRALPWPVQSRPHVVSKAMPELLAPSLAAVRATEGLRATLDELHTASRARPSAGARDDAAGTPTEAAP